MLHFVYELVDPRTDAVVYVVMIPAFLVHMWKKMVNKVYIAEGGQ